MSATDELRRLLDERGVEWWSTPTLVVSGVEKGTSFHAADGRLVRAVEALDGSICVSHLIPEQAIAATLGSCNYTSDERTNGTSRREVVSDEGTDGATGYCRCGACGRAVDMWDGWCRHCGARFEEG